MINCTFENGNKASLRHITISTIVIKENKILLGKRGTFQGKPILESGKWGLLGGFLDRDETFIQAVKREVMEESGYEIGNVKLLKINDNPNRPKEDRQNVDIIFFAEAIKQIGESDEEVKELKWFDLNSLPAKESIAFDHSEAIEIYKNYLDKKITLPVLG